MANHDFNTTDEEPTEEKQSWSFSMDVIQAYIGILL